MHHLQCEGSDWYLSRFHSSQDSTGKKVKSLDSQEKIFNLLI